MHLGLRGGDLLELSITGYQFPDAADVGLRYSWHMIGGTATTATETWTFHWQALTCDESERVAAWLLSAADAAQPAAPGRRPSLPAALSFTEPNLLFDLEHVDGLDAVRLRVELDLEFRAPSSRRVRGVGDPSLLHLATSAAQLRAAAAAWSVDVARFPDLDPYAGSR